MCSEICSFFTKNLATGLSFFWSRGLQVPVPEELVKDNEAVCLFSTTNDSERFDQAFDAAKA